VVVPFQLLPFVADVDEYMTGTKRAGTYAGAMTLVRKLIQGALVLPLLGLLLKLIGYTAEPGFVQTARTLQSLRVIFVVAPACLAVLGIMVSLRFPITPKSHALLRAELTRRASGGNPAEMDAETAKACGRMTGIDVS
jgi:oligogalacturonide transporter